jgi:hypothetical protein
MLMMTTEEAMRLIQKVEDHVEEQQFNISPASLEELVDWARHDPDATLQDRSAAEKAVVQYLHRCGKSDQEHYNLALLFL